MAYESVNVETLKSCLADLSTGVMKMKQYLGDTNNQLLPSGDGTSNWNSIVKDSVVSKISSISEKVDGINTLISNYNSVLSLISDYQATKKQLEEARRKQKEYEDAYNKALTSTDPLISMSASTLYSQMEDANKAVASLESKLSKLATEIEGSSL